MGVLAKVGLRRRMKWDPPTILDWILISPIQAVVFHLFHLVLWLRGMPVKPPRNKQPIRIVCISDTHESIVDKVPDGDLLVHSGDLTNDGTALSIQKQIDWLASLPHQHKVLVCGNHDSWFDHKSRREEDQLARRNVNLKRIHYLYRNSITLNFKDGRKLNVYGAPDIPQCGGSDNAFQYLHREDPWKDTIPLDTDILVTHTPPRNHLDLSLGCPGLLQEVWRTKPKVHVFGHVHCGRGVEPVFWDDLQRAYEKIMSDEWRGPIRDVLPTWVWVDVVMFLLHSTLIILWEWLWLGGARDDGSVMINAGMQDGNSGRLTKKAPFVIEI